MKGELSPSQEMIYDFNQTLNRLQLSCYYRKSFFVLLFNYEFVV